MARAANGRLTLGQRWLLFAVLLVVPQDGSEMVRGWYRCARQDRMEEQDRMVFWIQMMA